MNLFPLNKGLLWKEWRQNRWLFWVGIVLLGLVTILDSLVRLYNHYVKPLPSELENLYWVHAMDLGSNILLEHIPFFPFAALLALGLGGFLLSQERTLANTLDFLAATPVSRRDIVNAKFMTGLKMMGIVLGVNLAFVLLLALIYPAQYTGWQVIVFFLEQAVFLLANYSAGFFAASFCGNLLSTAMAATALVSGPYLIGNFIMGSSFGHYLIEPINNEFHRTWYQALNTLSLYHYATLRVDEVSLGKVLGMLIVAVVFYLLTVYLFEKNAFERNGRLLLFGDFWHLAQILVPLVIAFMFASSTTSALHIYKDVQTFLIAYLVLFLILKVIRRIIRNFGFR